MEAGAEKPAERPVRPRPAEAVHQLDVGRQCIQEPGEFERVELAVPVGIDDEREAGGGEEIAEGGPVAPVPRVPERPQLRNLPGQALEDFGGPIHAPVIQDQNLEVAARALERLPGSVNDPGDGTIVVESRETGAHPGVVAFHCSFGNVTREESVPVMS